MSDPPSAPRADPLSGLLVVLATVFIVVSIGLPLLGLRVFHGADLLLASAPWQAEVATGFRPTNPCLSDTVDSVMPGRTVFADRLHQGDFALRNPYPVGGAELGATPDHAVLSPFALPYLAMPQWLAPGYGKLLEMAASLGGTFLFLRRLSLTRSASVLGGLIFTSSGFLVVWTNWPQSAVAAMVPLLFWSIERLVQVGTVRAGLPGALVLAVMLLGGFPAVVGYACYAAGPYLVVRLWRRDGGHRAARQLATAAGAVALAVALVAFQLLPFLARLGELDLEVRQQSPDAHLPVRALWTLGIPRAFGSCAGDSWFGPLNEVEMSSYLGSAALVLVVLSLLVRRQAAPRGVRAFFAVATLVTVLLTYTGGPLLDLAQELPVLSDSFVGRTRSVLGFFLAVLAAIAYDTLVRGNLRRPQHRAGVLAAAAVWGAAAWVAAATVLAVHRRALAAGQAEVVDPSIAVAVAGAAVALLAVAVAARRRRDALRTVALGLLPVVVVVQSLVYVLPLWPRIPRDQFYPLTPTHVFLDTHLGSDRYAAEGYVLFPGTNTYYRQRSADGHAFTAPTWREALQAVDEDVFVTPTFTTFRPDGPAAVSPVLDRLAARYYVTAPDSAPRGVGTPAVGAGRIELQRDKPLEMPVPSSALRGVGVDVLDPTDVPGAFADMEVSIIDTTGRVVAQAGRRIFGRLPSGSFVVPIAGEHLAGAAQDSLTAYVTLRAGEGEAAVPIRADRGVASPVLFTAAPWDGLELVQAGGATVYERLNALPRFRWASRSRVVADPQARLGALADGDVPADTVLLSKVGPPGDARSARVEVVADHPDEMRVRVDAEGAGYLVVADALQRGWAVKVNGRPAELVEADHALVAVALPAGTSDVRLAYEPVGLAEGRAVSLIAVLLLAGAWLLARRWQTGVASTSAPPSAHRRLA